jgi:flagella basal body P-ring formation protein FlgA
MRAAIVVPICLLLGLTGTVAAQEQQSHESIMQSVATFIEQEFQPSNDAVPGELSIKVAAPDSRRRLTRCATPLQVFWPFGRKHSRHISVGVQCEGPTPWKLFLQATVRHYKPVAVLQRQLRKGERLHQDMLTLERRDVLSLRAGYLDDVDSSLGMLVNRSLPAGTVVNANLLAHPSLVRRGDLVQIVAGAGGVAVNTQGTALSDGRQGEIIQVRNNGSKRVLQAMVTRSHTVEVMQ